MWPCTVVATTLRSVHTGGIWLFLGFFSQRTHARRHTGYLSCFNTGLRAGSFHSSASSEPWPGPGATLHKPESDKGSVSQADYDYKHMQLNNPSVHALSLHLGNGRGWGRSIRRMHLGPFANEVNANPTSFHLRSPPGGCAMWPSSLSYSSVKVSAACLSLETTLLPVFKPPSVFPCVTCLWADLGAAAWLVCQGNATTRC